ncbi:hypothetical protein PSAC2689_190053 [Paraburkholderia sacchari]|uniref:MFS transporter n=1 Tax=Paraburkholderia sacchari TaxID=159450 RepID=UPI0039A4E3AA
MQRKTIKGCVGGFVAWCILKHNWKFAFVVTGGAALIWVALWLVVFRSPAENPRLAQEEAEYIRAGQDAAQRSTAGKLPLWKEVLKQRRFRGIGIPRMPAEPAWQTFGAWIALYMFTVRHMNLKEIALFAWMPFLAADLGCLVGGYLAPLFIGRFGCSLITSRKLVITTGAVVGWRLISNQHKDNERDHAVCAALRPAHRAKA